MSEDEPPLESGAFDFEAAVRRLVEHHFKVAPRDVRQLTGGLNNRVFAVEHDTRRLVVRLSDQAQCLNTFLKEQWAIDAARQAGVPAPDVLEVGNDVIGVPYMVMDHVEGTIGTEAEDRVAVLHALGQLARLVHTIPTQGFGHTFDWSSNKLSRSGSWAEFLHTELDLDGRLEFLRRWRLLPAANIERLEASLEALSGSSAGGVLNHGDLRLKNILLDAEGRIAAVIDWEHSLSAVPPSWDLAIALHDLTIDEKQAFCDGYGLSPQEIRELAPVVKALNVVNYVPLIRKAVHGDDDAAFERFRTRLAGAFDLYSV